MNIAATSSRFRSWFMIALLPLLAAVPAVGQQVSAPAEHKHRSIQKSPGEGDTGESEGMDEAAGLAKVPLACLSFQSSSLSPRIRDFEP